MPSPIGHGLGGIAAGYLIASASGGRAALPRAGEARGGTGPVRELLLLARGRLTWTFAALGVLPDIDFLFGAHNMYTHSLGAAVLVWAAALLVTRGGIRVSTAAAAAYASHVLLDWLVRDTSPPLGIMALWPFSDAFYMSPVPLMMGISRRYWLPGFWAHNLTAVAYETVVLGTSVALVWCLRVRRSGSRAGSAP